MIDNAWVAFLVAFAVGLGAVGGARVVALRLSFHDQPGGHKSHGTPVPYLGGAGIMCAAFVVLALYSRIGGRLTLLLLLGLVLGCVGLLDDRVNLSAKVRLAAQTGAALIATLS